MDITYHLNQGDSISSVKIRFLDVKYKNPTSLSTSSWHHGQRSHLLTTVQQMNRLLLSPKSSENQALLPAAPLKKKKSIFFYRVQQLSLCQHTNFNRIEAVYTTPVNMLIFRKRLRASSQQYCPTNLTWKGPCSLPQIR